MRAYLGVVSNRRVYAHIYAYVRAYTRFASRKCDDAAATLKLGHLVTPGPFLSDAAASHTNQTPFGHWDTLPPLSVRFSVSLLAVCVPKLAVVSIKIE